MPDQHVSCTRCPWDGEWTEAEKVEPEPDEIVPICPECHGDVRFD